LAEAAQHNLLKPSHSVSQSIEYAKAKRRQYRCTASEADKVIV